MGILTYFSDNLKVEVGILKLVRGVNIASENFKIGAGKL